jgi:hypothetical protein
MFAGEPSSIWPPPSSPYPSTEPLNNVAYQRDHAYSGSLDARDYLKPIHIATFNLQGYGRVKADKPQVIDQVARLCRNFEVVALQGIIGPDRDLLPRLVDTINRSGARFDYLEFLEGQSVRLAFLFDTRRIETDRRQLYTVADPGRVLTVPPIVAWFRTSEGPRKSAWTFSLVNVWLDPTRAEQEAQIVPQILRAVQSDGRSEDDVLLAGSFQLETVAINRLMEPMQYRSAAVGSTTDIHQRSALEHLLLPTNAKSEFTGRAGTIDFLRMMNLTLGEAEEITDRLPVWAEFDVMEAD